MTTISDPPCFVAHNRHDYNRHKVHKWHSAPSANNPNIFKSCCGYAISGSSDELNYDLRHCENYCKICFRDQALLAYRKVSQ